MTKDCKLCKYSAICVTIGAPRLFWGSVDKKVDNEMTRLARKHTYNYDAMEVMRNMTRATISAAQAAHMRPFLPPSCELWDIVGRFRNG